MSTIIYDGGWTKATREKVSMLEVHRLQDDLAVGKPPAWYLVLSLSEREQGVIRGLANGFNIREIAKRYNTTEGTIAWLAKGVIRRGKSLGRVYIEYTLQRSGII